MTPVLALAYVAFNMWLGAVMYLDVTRRRRSLWWLLGIKLCALVVVPLYLLTRSEQRRSHR